MKVRIIEASEREAWDSYVMGNPKSIAWQLYTWYDVVRQHYNVHFFPLAVFEADKIRGILPLYYYKSMLKQGTLISVPFAVAGGIVADNDEVSELLLNEAIEISKRHDNCRIVLKQYKYKIPGALSSDENYYNRELTLVRDKDELLNQISENNRDKIEEAKNAGFEIVYPAANINEFYKVVNIHHHRNGIPCVTKKWIKLLIDSGMYSMAIINREGKAVAATMVKEFKDTISFPFTSLMGESELHYLGVYNLYWHMISTFAQTGKGIFHSGRIPINDETSKFRLGWGGEKFQYYNQYFPQSVVNTEYSQKRGKKRELFTNVWSHLPRPLINLVNPFLVKQFP